MFILAIDYQVVVKGLEHKFGKQTPENEWEFRAFFDKIIQLPFMMPMGQYDIGNYVSSLLVDVGFIEKDSVDTEDIKEIVLLTIGGNPRSIKRLINSVSLIEIFTEEKLNFAGVEEAKTEETKEEKFLLFSLLCLQIAYPAVYSLLIEEPDFLKWNEDFAFSHTNKEEEKEKELFDKEYQNAIQTEDFDEDWEKALYRICYIRPRLKPRVTDISKFFTFIKDKYTEGDDEDLGTTIQEVLSKTSVTSVSATDQAQNIVLPEREKGSYKRRVLNDLDTYLLDLKVTHNCCEKSVQTNKYIHDKMLEKFKDITPYYTGSMTFQFNKRKFMKISAKYENENSFLVKAQILKHYKHDYMIPALDGFEIKMGRKFSKGKMSTAHNAEFYELRILDESVYKKNENPFLEMHRRSI